MISLNAHDLLRVTVPARMHTYCLILCIMSELNILSWNDSPIWVLKFARMHDTIQRAACSVKSEGATIRPLVLYLTMRNPTATLYLTIC